MSRLTIFTTLIHFIVYYPVPTDGSGQAFKAVLKAIQIAEFYEARITLLMCVELEKEISAFEQVSLSGYVPSELSAAAYDFLSELMLVVPSDIKVKTRVEIDDPGETIVEFAKYVKENATCNVVLVEGLPDDWADEDNLNFTGK